MGRLTFGATKIELGTFDEVTGASSAWEEIPVFNESFSITEPDPQKTEFFQQGRKNPRLTRFNASAMEVAFQTMDTDPDSLAAILGGTVTTVNGKKRWNAPKVRNEVVKSLRITAEDGSVLTIPKFTFYPKLNMTITEANINLIDVTGTPSDTGLEEVPDMTWDEPEE